jgi:hypothetical protein
MAANNDFLSVLVKDVTLFWPRLDQPYRYNAQEKKTEACAPGVQGAGYSIAWDCPTAEAKALYSALRAHYNDCRTRNSKLPEMSQVFGMKKDDATGTVRFTAKKRAMSNAGTPNKAPVVIDANKAELANKAIWSNSTGNLRVLAFPTTDPDGKGGISLLLDAVQVVEAVYGGDGLDDFEIVAAPAATTAASADPFADVADDTPAAPKPATNTAVPADAEWV